MIKSQEFIDLSDQTFIALMELKNKKMDYNSQLTCKGNLTIEHGFVPYTEKQKRRQVREVMFAKSFYTQAEKLFKVLWVARRRLQKSDNDEKVNK